MYRKFLNARSPLRLLEKGLHGGLGIGNIGTLLAGHGVGKTSFMVGVALDELLRGGNVLHVALDQTLTHVRDYYDTVFEALASTTQLEDAARTHAEVDARRIIHAYPPAEFCAAKLRDAIQVDSEAGKQPSLILIEGLDLARSENGELAEIREIAQKLAAEVWISVTCEDEQVEKIPDEVARNESQLSVILALEPGNGVVTLRALKDHGNADLHDLHVALDPKTLLLVRN